MSEPVSRPSPPENALSAPYWEGLYRGELRYQVCMQCGTARHYPRLLCSACYDNRARWQVASGRGSVHSWTVAHYAYHPGFANELPYTLVTVDLEEGLRALGRWYGDELVIGMPVAARIEQRDGAPELGFEPR